MLDIILWICIALNLTACAINILTIRRYRKGYEELYERKKEYVDILLRGKQALFEQLGAYPSEKEGYMYIDLEGGLRLVIFEGKIDGWYMP